MQKTSQTTGGVINGNQSWNADTVLVNADLEIDSLATLEIQPGVKVLFTGNYGITVKGRITARGLPDQRIEFCHQNKNQFAADTLQSNCWQGIFFNSSNSQSGNSSFEYCVFENVKYLKNDSTLPEYYKFGGVLRLYNFSNLIIENCIFKNNVARYGTAISCFYQSSPLIISNLFTQNTAVINAPAIFNAHSYPKIVNNTIAGNSIMVQHPFTETAAVYNFISKPWAVNNIIYHNRTYDAQISLYKDFYTFNNDVESLENSGMNISTDPLFADTVNYLLTSESPCINSGKIGLHGISWPDYDLNGKARIWNGDIDMGACEYHAVSIGSNLQQKPFMLSSYPNPFNNSTQIIYSLNKPGNVKIEVLNLRGEVVYSCCDNYVSEKNRQLSFDGSGLSSGVYHCRITGEGISLVHRMLLVK